MPRDTAYDFFVSYASADNNDGWVDAVVNEVVAEHARFTGGRKPTFFLDRQDICHLSHWHAEIFNKGLARSRFFLAFLSPNYFASEICRKEWRAWIEQEISLHILTGGAAPIYFVEVPGFLSKPILPEHEVAAKVAELCGIAPSERFATDLSPVVKEARRRQLVNLVQPLKNAGVKALQEADLNATLATLARHIEERVEEVKRADASANTVPPYNPKFTGRLDELLELRTMLTDNRAGVIAGIHGLGGIGKTELAYTYAHAFAGVYPGGRFEVKCEYQTSLRDAVLIALSGYPEFRDHISDEERKHPDLHFAAVTRVLTQRLDALGTVLLVLDNVSDLKLLESQQTDQLTVLGSKLHLLATTRLPAGKMLKCLTLGKMKPDDALALLDKFCSFQTDDDRTAAESIVKQLGGFALAIELVAAKLTETPSASYAAVADGLGLADLDTLAEDASVELRRHNHEKRLAAVLGPTLTVLTAEERRAMEFAALLPPDNVPLPWLKSLVTADFPELAIATKWGDLWHVLVDRLTRLGLFTHVLEKTTITRQVKVHRLVQELLQREMPAEVRERLQTAIHCVVKACDAVLEQTTNWVEAAWELEPFEELAKLWDKWEYQERSWALNQAALRRYTIAQYRRAEMLWLRVGQIDAQSESDDPSAVASQYSLAQLFATTNRRAESETLLKEAILKFVPRYGSAHLLAANMVALLAELHIDKYQHAEAEHILRLGIVAYSGRRECRTAEIRLLAALGHILVETARSAEASSCFRRAIDLAEAPSESPQSALPPLYNNYARLLGAHGHLVQAEQLHRRALAMDLQLFGPRHPNVARDLNLLARLLHDAHRLEEAETLQKQALEIDESVFGEFHPNTATHLNNLGQILQHLGRHGAAELYLRRALRIAEVSCGEFHHGTGIALNNLALCLESTGMVVEAREYQERAVHILQSTLGNDHPTTKVAQRTLFRIKHT